MMLPNICAATFAVAAAFGTIFWQRPAANRHEWPSSIPAFSQAAPRFSMETKNGSSVISFISNGSTLEVLADACAAYLSEGWRELPVGTSDMRLFAKGESVAAVLVQTTTQGTCVTAIQRPHGL